MVIWSLLAEYIYLVYSGRCRESIFWDKLSKSARMRKLSRQLPIHFKRLPINRRVADNEARSDQMCNNEHLQRKCCKDFLLVNLLSQCFHSLEGPRSHGPHAHKKVGGWQIWSEKHQPLLLVLLACWGPYFTQQVLPQHYYSREDKRKQWQAGKPGAWWKCWPHTTWDPLRTTIITRICIDHFQSNNYRTH